MSPKINLEHILDTMKCHYSSIIGAYQEAGNIWLQVIWSKEHNVKLWQGACCGHWS